jgi:hypothetical protein
MVCGCADQFEIVGDPMDEENIPPTVQEAFDRACAYDGCHDAVTQAGDLSLVAQDAPAIIGAPSVQSELPMVEMGSVEGSYLAIKMLPEENLPPGVERVGTLMPPAPTDEELEDMALIIGWIAGAELPADGGE